MSYPISEETMQKLADADSALADLVMESMVNSDDTDPEVLNGLMNTGLALFNLQFDLVERGLAEKVMERSDRAEVEADV